MKTVYTTLAAIMTLTGSLQAKTYVINSGKWSDAKVWNNEYIGTTIKAEDVVIVAGHVTVNVNITVEGTLQIEKGASFVGMKDLTIAKGGKLINNGNTTMKSIINEGSITNNMILEAMYDVQNRSQILNNNNLVAGNNLNLISGNAGGNNGAYFANNSIQTAPAAKISNNVRLFQGNGPTNTASTSATNLSLNAEIQPNAVVLSVLNPAKVIVTVFSIEKSFDGKNYQLVDLVNASNSDVAMTYSDTKFNNQLTYYRVTAICNNGSETTLPIATVKTNFDNALSMAQ
ncbi:MAG: hypothetical protein NZM35_10260 [Chitinophagales bacterium]|nr:hypothetical protein [Chitinophagales bacterium]